MKQKITIFSLGAFGLDRQLATLGSVYRQDYAQYKNCLQMLFVPKGKRTTMRRTFATNPHVVVVEGWRDDIEFPSGMEKTDMGQRSRFASFAPEYKAEASDFFQKLRERNDAPILIDGETNMISGAVEVQQLC